MKKIKQKTKRKIVLAVCVLAAALVIVLIVQGVRGLFYKKHRQDWNIFTEKKKEILRRLRKKSNCLKKKTEKKAPGNGV